MAQSLNPWPHAKVKSTETRKSHVRPQKMKTSFPGRESVLFALHAGDPRARKEKKSRRRTASQLLGIAMRDAQAFHRRVQFPRE